MPSAAHHAVAGVKGRHSHSHRSAAPRRLQLQDSGLAYVQCDHWRSQARPLGLHGHPAGNLDTLLLLLLDHRTENAAPLMEDNPRRRGQPELGFQNSSPGGAERSESSSEWCRLPSRCRGPPCGRRGYASGNALQWAVHPAAAAACQKLTLKLLRPLPHQAAVSPQSEMVSCGQGTGRSVPTHGEDPTAHTSAREGRTNDAQASISAHEICVGIRGHRRSGSGNSQRHAQLAHPCAP